MSLKEKLSEDLKRAMRAKDQPRLNCVRMLKSKIQEKEVEARGKHGADHKLDEQALVDVVASYAKQRRDSMAQYEELGREDLAAKERDELALLADYLPEQLDEAQIREIVAAAVAESGATEAKQMGAVMKLVMPQVKGKADGKLVNKIVKEHLN